VGLKDVQVLAYERRGPDVELMVEQVVGVVVCPACGKAAQVKEGLRISAGSRFAQGHPELGEGASSLRRTAANLRGRTVCRLTGTVKPRS